MQPLLILQLLVLLTLANGSPVIAKRLLGNRFSYPLDGGVRFVDGQPLFGSSKTIRGILLSVLVTLACAPLIGLEWEIGARVGSAAMAGDLVSSFLKRRLRLPAGARASGLDQVPESLFALLACRHALSLTAGDIAAGVVIFAIGDVLVSRLLYKFHVRDRPY
jgi:CDP-2,3-bis-(O-geranylgeranyl)-sn-glycerol synthase